MENTNTLILRSSGLSGPIPNEISELVNLVKLDLSGNQLTDEIPPEIGNLTNLTTLNLTENQLTGIIPNEICNQGDNSPTLENNQLCPPYPICIEENIGIQETSKFPIELWGNL